MRPNLAMLFRRGCGLHYVKWHEKVRCRRCYLGFLRGAAAGGISHGCRLRTAVAIARRHVRPQRSVLARLVLALGLASGRRRGRSMGLTEECPVMWKSISALMRLVVPPRRQSVAEGCMPLNMSAHAEPQLQEAASPRVLRSGGLQRWAARCDAYESRSVRHLPALESGLRRKR